MNNNDLFRREAIEARQTRWTGNAVSIRPISATFFTGFLCAVAALVILFVCFGSYTKKERVTGLVMPVDGVIRLRAPENAVVSTIAVKDGQDVKPGDILIELTQERFSDQGSTQALVDQNITQQRERMRSQLNENAKSGRASSAAVRERGKRAESDLVHSAEEIRLQEQQVLSSEKVLRDLKPLVEEKIVSELQYQQQFNQLLELRARLEALRRSQSALRAEITIAESEATALDSRTANDKSLLERTVMALEQDRLQRRAASVTQIRAPIAGTITALTAVIGQRVEPSATLAALIPAGSRMEAVLFVPSSAIGFIKTGRNVKLRYDAYPFEKFGQYAGHVSAVSEADIPTIDLGSAVAVPRPDDKRTTFRVRVALDDEYVEAYGNRIKVRPGQTLAADIELDRRRLIEWIFDPLYAIGKRM
ncbi:MAG: HlyD family efflux transporter periplasmic adaptor subunit [Usitatibacteraceae bacterium]